MSGVRQKHATRWYRLLEKYEGSTLSQAEFCRAEGLRPHNFRYWHKKHKTRISIGSKGFISVLPKKEDQSICIRYRSGVELELPATYPLEKLVKLIEVSS